MDETKNSKGKAKLSMSCTVIKKFKKKFRENSKSTVKCNSAKNEGPAMENKFMKEVRGRHRDDHHLHIFSFYTIVYTVQVTDTK